MSSRCCRLGSASQTSIRSGAWSIISREPLAHASNEVALGALSQITDLFGTRIIPQLAKRGASRAADALPVAVDVLDDRALVAEIARVEKDCGLLNGMAPVIGMATWALLLDCDFETWDTAHRRGLRYFFVAAREVAKHLIARGSPGSIVCTASVDGARCASFHGSCSAAKAGLTNLVKMMTVEWGGPGIRINVVAPSTIITPRIPHMGEAEAKITERIPMLRRGTVDEIAGVIVFFLSDMVRYICRQTLAVGGRFLAQYSFGLVPREAGSMIGAETR